MPFAYTVVATIADPAIADAWVNWLRNGHITDILAAGALSAELIALDGGPERSFEVSYRFASRADFARYERDHAPRLRAEGLRMFPAQARITYRRVVGDVIGTFSSGDVLA
jgi:hypothetical protein